MTIPLLIVAALQAFVTAFLLFRIRNLQKQLKGFSRVVDVEAHLAACEEGARLAIEQQRVAAADLTATETQLNALKTAISHYQTVLGPVKNAAELQDQIQRDTAKAKQLSAALGKFENALQLKEF